MSDKPMVQIETSHGEIILELDRAKAPISVDNFIAYAEAGHYDGTIFHRVIKGFMIQGGGLTADMQEKPTNEPIINEAPNKLKNKTGTVAMGRTAEINSATAQFFISPVDNSCMNHQAPTAQGYGYAVFGKVVEGMDVVDAIRVVETGNHNMHQDVPLETVTINATSVVE